MAQIASKGETKPITYCFNGVIITWPVSCGNIHLVFIHLSWTWKFGWIHLSSLPLSEGSSINWATLILAAFKMQSSFTFVHVLAGQCIPTDGLDSACVHSCAKPRVADGFRSIITSKEHSSYRPCEIPLYKRHDLHKTCIPWVSLDLFSLTEFLWSNRHDDRRNSGCLRFLPFGGTSSKTLAHMTLIWHLGSNLASSQTRRDCLVHQSSSILTAFIHHELIIHTSSRTCSAMYARMDSLEFNV